MIPTSREDGDKPRQDSPGLDTTESRLTALARNLVDTVGVEGAIRYCSSLGWRGVLQEIEILRRQRGQLEAKPNGAAGSH